MNFRMRMLTDHRRQLNALLSDTSREQACFLVCRSARGDGETLLLVHEVLPLHEGELLIHAPDQLSVSPAAMLRMARYAQRTESALCMVHTHPMSVGQVGFSWADDIGNERTFDFLNRILPGRPNSCLVWDRGLQCVAGRVYTAPNAWYAISSVDIVGEDRWQRLRDRKINEVFSVAEEFDRQARVLGGEGQSFLGQLRIGVIGCGGIGSVVATLLGHSGIKDITLIDFDHVEASNLPRLLGASKMDAIDKVAKTEVIQRTLAEIDPTIRVHCIDKPVEDPSILLQLVTLDAIICATDDTTSRAYLNQLCQQYYVPLIDLGVQFVADMVTGKLVREIGKVNLTLPATPCLACVGHIDSRVLEEEGLTSERRAQRRAEGYVRGLDVPEPSMMMFNMQVAAKGVQLLIAWITGLHTVDSHTYERLSFLGLTGHIGSTRTRKRGEHNCPICASASVILGAGDLHEMLVMPRPK